MPNLTTRGSFWDGSAFQDWAGLTADQWSGLLGENCLPEAVYGPIHHTLFLGCSVSSFSSSLGWNEQQSELTVNLVEDPCAGTKIYWDADLQVQLWTAADPGFIGESADIIGSPAYFRVDNFEYTGIIQSWNKSSSSSGYPTYTVKLVDPRQLLEGSQMIIGEYGGGVGSVYNLFNVFGYMESQGQSCSQTYLQDGGLPTTGKYLTGDGGADGSMFGSEANAFGGANVNENGMQWTYIVTALNALINTGLTNVWSPYGRLLLKATNSAFGMGLLSGDRYDTLGAFTSLPDPANRWLAEYFLDLSEVPTPPTYWRLNSTYSSIMDAVSTLLTDAGYDYYIELIPVRGVSSLIAPSGIAKFIKVRTVKRLLQPTLGQISAFIGNSEGTVDTGVGNELRNEPTTSFLIGGRKNPYYQIEATDLDVGELDDDTIVPHFGLNANGTYITPEFEEQDDGVKRFKFDIDVTALDSKLRVLTFPNATITMTELELLAARTEYDTWFTYVVAMETDTGNILRAANAGGAWDMDGIIKNIDAIIANNAKAGDVVNVGNNNAFFGVARDEEGVAIQEDIRTIFGWVETLATEYYGKKFQVSVPFTCVRQDSESAQILTSENPTQTGWTERTNLLGLVNGSAQHAFLTDEDGKTECMMRFDFPATGVIDYIDLKEDDYIVYGNAIYIRCEVEDRYVYSSSLTNPRAIVTLPGYVKYRDRDEVEAAISARLLYQLVDLNVPPADQADANDGITKAIKGVGNKMGFAPLDFMTALPGGVGFGIQSNVLTYGPWATAGPAGTVKVDHDTGLVPWEYGGLATLNLAGNTKANEGITYMQVGEQGNITVPGFPIIPLGAELGAYDGGFYGAGTNLIENRVASLTGSYYTTSIGGWTGLYGPNVTDINVSVGEDGLNTTYTMRTYTPKFGRFAQYNADRLKLVGRNRLQFSRNLARLQLSIASQLVKKRFKQAGIGAAKGVKDKGAALNVNSPHQVLVGESTTFRTDYRRSSIATVEMKELCVDLKNDYGSKAFMSFDGLIRPVSMDGDGGLPPYATPVGGNCFTNTAGAQPPISDGVDTYYDEVISIDYLNPFSNPSGKSRSTVRNKIKAGDSYVGHDIDLLGRNDTVPTGANDGPEGMNMPWVGYKDDDQSDYYDDYRMFAMRGPLLLQSWGYDLDGRPVPNRADSEVSASNGIFTNEGVECYFLSEWLKKPHTWPVAPIDLRFDRHRGVWVSPPAYRLVYGTLEDELCCDDTTVEVKLANPASLDTPSMYDCNGDSISSAYIVVNNLTNQCLPSGEPVIAYYDPYACEYLLLQQSAPKFWNLACSGVAEDLEFVGCFHDLVAGTGLHIHEVEGFEGCCGYAISNNIGICGPIGCNESYEESPSAEDIICVSGIQDIILGTGLILSANDECEIRIDTCPRITIEAEAGCPPEGTEPDGERYDTIRFLDGLKAGIDSEDSATVEVGLSFDVGGVPDVNNIQLGDCLQAESVGDCGAKISFHEDIVPEDGGRIWFVSDVECSGSSLVITKQYFDFSNCGTITATGE